MSKLVIAWKDTTGRNYFAETIYDTDTSTYLDWDGQKGDFVKRDVSSPKREEVPTITHDSISLGWEGNEHVRMLLLIRNGEIIHQAKKKDSQLSNTTVIEQDIIRWAKKAIKDFDYEGEYVFKPGGNL